ncbi:MAG: hypothetical protein JNJ58_08740 [Chitinophagaceae bacterium]|nr:hypothetical protein [Chitinophagaceae bacterium]
MPEFVFPASLDKLSKSITIAIAVGFLVFLFVPLFVPELRYAILFQLALFLLILLVAWVYSPRSYEVNAQEILIHRKAGDYKISRDQLASVMPLSSEDMGQAWRMFGNGGVFGYTGWFSSRKIGKMRWFVTQRNNYILLTLKDGRKMVISPDDPKGFLAAIQP